ncbi:uncharacterized threonine-rich GPI-anchored glycoprotein PJ4664.02-like [Zingiber officinale]|uniref:Uncharacterized protein n=1 Tax=Zingiber officinale TaxID=94328 RepID=A0A8J5F8U0_ZINOF|nr:uncharacterized threonine-rich GPI-anchored glycoprotein PJ4664.02-like [Zingiber officinale]KAG6482429.1 hypothetical protein ZIOFF_059060 [Zingiber officinale]
MEDFPAIDVSFGEDPRDRSSSGAVEGSTPVKANKQMEKSLQLPVPSNKHKSIFSKDYLAKSLDWDRDFLTSEGVLDFEELASLNSTFRRIDTCSLSVIPEESKRSTTTNSTLSDDDNLALENLELHLFENNGASMKTFSTGVKASGSEKSSRRNIPRRGHTLSLELPTKFEASQNKKSPVVSEQHGASNHRLQNTSRWVKVVKGYMGVTAGKTVSKPTSALSKLNLSTMPAKTTIAPGSIQIRTSDFREKPGNVAIQNAVISFKQLHKGSSSGISKFQASKTTSNLISNSSGTAHYSLSENTRMRSNSRVINNPSSESMANKTSSSRSNTNQSFSRRNGARTVHTSANNSTISRGLSVGLSLPTPSSNSCFIATSVSSSLTLCSVKPVMNSNEANSSTPSVMDVDANEIHSACSKSSFASIAQDDGYHRSHISKGFIDNHVMPIPLKGNHSKSSSGNRSEAISSKPSGHNVAHPKPTNPDMKKPVNHTIGTLSQASQQPKLPKVTGRTNKTAAVNKAKQTMFQHVRSATNNKIINGHSRVASSCSSSIESLPFIQFEYGGSSDCSGQSNL